MTREEKEQYFATHLSNEYRAVIKYGDGSCAISPVAPHQLQNISHLLLTSLENITDEDFLQMWAQIDIQKAANYQKWYIANKKEYIKDFFTSKFSPEIFHSIKMIDFLRSRGYSTPFRNYSIEDLIKEGVLKLK